jgi:hypothetical protein
MFPSEIGQKKPFQTDLWASILEIKSLKTRKKVKINQN